MATTTLTPAPKPRLPWAKPIRHRGLPYAAGAVAGLVLLGAAIWFVQSPYWSHGCGGKFSGMSRTTTKECVGVIDRADQLDSSLQGLFDSIQRENQAVTASGGPYVKIVLLTPLSKSATSP